MKTLPCAAGVAGEGQETLYGEPTTETYMARRAFVDM